MFHLNEHCISIAFCNLEAQNELRVGMCSIIRFHST